MTERACSANTNSVASYCDRSMTAVVRRRSPERATRQPPDSAAAARRRRRRRQATASRDIDRHSPRQWYADTVVSPRNRAAPRRWASTTAVPKTTLTSTRSKTRTNTTTMTNGWRRPGERKAGKLPVSNISWRLVGRRCFDTWDLEVVPIVNRSILVQVNVRCWNLAWWLFFHRSMTRRWARRVTCETVISSCLSLSSIWCATS